MLALGVLMIVLGVIALFMIPFATVLAVFALGWVMLLSGIAEGIHAFTLRSWIGDSLHIVGAVVGVLFGLLILTHPRAGALVMTMLFGAFFMTIGIFRVIEAAHLKFLNWGWAELDGVITLAVGLILLAGWPRSGYWFLGLAVGLSLLFRGLSYVMMAAAIHALPQQAGIRKWPGSRAA